MWYAVPGALLCPFNTRSWDSICRSILLALVFMLRWASAQDDGKGSLGLAMPESMVGEEVRKIDQPNEEMNPMVLIHTSHGDIKVELYPDKAPLTVANFLRYVDEGFYNGTLFHRIIPDFVIQGGGFTRDLRQKATREPIANEATNGLRNVAGTLAMARTPHVHSATSQFFINLRDNPFLDHTAPTPQGYGYCVFGRVVEGMDIVDKISRMATTTRGAMQNVPVEPVEILSMERLP